jgi:hypothetical protein
MGLEFGWPRKGIRQCRDFVLNSFAFFRAGTIGDKRFTLVFRAGTVEDNRFTLGRMPRT